MMDYSSLPAEAPPKTRADRALALFEVILLSGVISGFLAVLPFSFFHVRDMTLLLKNATYVSIYLLVDTAITFVILGAILKAHQESLASLGLHWENWKRNIAMGLVLVPLLFLINALVSIVFKILLPHYYFEQNPLTDPIHTPQELALFIFSALLAGGIREEVQRAFIINRFRSYLGGAGVGLVLWSIAFGTLHSIQHAQGVVVATVFGFSFGLIYLVTGSLVAPIIAHGAYDSLALLAYWFFSSHPK
jgi:membrane protease YdiL (CAAX protease family)